jgi:hypothetical protein
VRASIRTIVGAAGHSIAVRLLRPVNREGSVLFRTIHFVNTLGRWFDEGEDEEDYENQQEKKSGIHFLLHNIINR